MLKTVNRLCMIAVCNGVKFLQSCLTSTHWVLMWTTCVMFSRGGVFPVWPHTLLPDSELYAFQSDPAAIFYFVPALCLQTSHLVWNNTSIRCLHSIFMILWCSYLFCLFLCASFSGFCGEVLRWRSSECLKGFCGMCEKRKCCPFVFYKGKSSGLYTRI